MTKYRKVHPTPSSPPPLPPVPINPFIPPAPTLLPLRTFEMCRKFAKSGGIYARTGYINIEEGWGQVWMPIVILIPGKILVYICQFFSWLFFIICTIFVHLESKGSNFRIFSMPWVKGWLSNLKGGDG